MSVFFQENVSSLAPYGGIEDQRCDTQDSYQRDTGNIEGRVGQDLTTSHDTSLIVERPDLAKTSSNYG